MCRANAKCRWFTFVGQNSACILFKDCSAVDQTCKNCVSGERECQDNFQNNLPTTPTIDNPITKGN